MNTKIAIEQLADLKFKEATNLFMNGRFDGAYYIGGYVVELLLKARVCKTLDINDFFLFNFRDKEVYKPFKSHDCERLLIFSGLYSEFHIECKMNDNLKKSWSVISEWDENSRYSLGKTKKET